jgi:ApaG protein
MGKYTQTTHAITVTVEPFFLEEQSTPEENHYVWAYHVQIENRGRNTVQLVTRHWRITDSSGNVQDVRGEGVVGEQPVLQPGESFEYTSGTPLPTPSGFMAGTYQMENETGERMDVEVPAFSLDSPFEATRIH